MNKIVESTKAIIENSNRLQSMAKIFLHNNYEETATQLAEISQLTLQATVEILESINDSIKHNTNTLEMLKEAQGVMNENT